MKLTDTNRYFLNTPIQPRRFLHLATIQDGLRDYICLFDTLEKKTYIEDFTGGFGPNFIEDDLLAEELVAFLKEHKVLDVSKPILSDREWLWKKPNEK